MPFALASLEPGAALDFWPVVRARYVASFFRWRALFAASDLEEIPPWHLSLGAGAKMALDELALALVATSADLPGVEDRRRSNAEVMDALELYTSRGWLDDPRSYHALPPPLERPDLRPDPRLEVVSTATTTE